MPDFIDVTATPGLEEADSSDHDRARTELQSQSVDPDNPPWGVGSALFVWFISVALIVFVPLLFLIPYASYRGVNTGMPDYAKTLTEFAISDKTAVLLQVLSLFPSHLLTLGLIWIVVTRFGKRSFWAAIGWEWPRHFPWWLSVVLGIVLFALGAAIAKVLGGDKPTQLEQIINSSLAARYAISFLAVFTAPLVEELVYRGVLYSAVRRDVGVFVTWTLALVFGVKLDASSRDRLGVVAAVVLVLALFTIIHVPQYWPNVGVIAAVALLSIALTIVRAYSGRLLPCVVIHLVFNGIQAVLLIVEPYTHRLIPTSDQLEPTASVLLPLMGSLF